MMVLLMNNNMIILCQSSKSKNCEILETAYIVQKYSFIDEKMLTEIFSSYFRIRIILFAL